MTEEEYRKLANDMFGLDGETDPEVQKEFDLLKALNIAHWSETGTAQPENEVELELYAKKIRQAEAIMELSRDFDEEDNQIGTNETGLPDIMYF